MTWLNEGGSWSGGTRAAMRARRTGQPLRGKPVRATAHNPLPGKALPDLCCGDVAGPQMIGAILAASVTDRRNGNGSDTYASGLGLPPVPRTITVP
jgi:hypothetical protein